MCQAHVLRFSCGHGILMGIDPCRLGPCPLIKTTGTKLPQQPYRCYNCQNKRSSTMDSTSSKSSSSPSLSSLGRVSSRPTGPLPGISRQLSGVFEYCSSSDRRRPASAKSFSFSCLKSDHYPTPHYSSLPTHLPHQSHPCPPCQIENYRSQSDQDATALAMAEFPHLRGEMLVRNGRIREDWQSTLTLDKYVAEKRRDDREMWLHVARKWTQDLKKARVLVAEEDGLGLMS